MLSVALGWALPREESHGLENLGSYLVSLLPVVFLYLLLLLLGEK